MTRYLYLSPHLDDVVLSAGATIASRLEAGDDVCIVTVFSGEVDSNAKEKVIYRERRAEDKEATSLLSVQSGNQCKSIYLGLADAPFRDPKYNSFETIVNSPSPVDCELRETLRTQIDELLEIERSDVLIAPLGVGRHIDHRLVFEEALALTWAGEYRFYEDFPYAFVPGAVSRRWSSLGARPKTLGAVLPHKEYPQVSFLAGYRKESEVDVESREVLGWIFNDNSYYKCPVTHSKLQMQRRLLAIAAYTSQVPALFDTELEAAKEAIVDLYGNCPEVEWRIQKQTATVLPLPIKEK